MVIAMHPEPVPTSTIIGFGGNTRFAGFTPGKYGLPARLSTASMICSVSGRGIKTSGVTRKLRP